MPAEGTVPFGKSWPSDISWNRLNVEPLNFLELMISSSCSPVWSAVYARSVYWTGTTGNGRSP